MTFDMGNKQNESHIPHYALETLQMFHSNLYNEQLISHLSLYNSTGHNLNNVVLLSSDTRHTDTLLPHQH